MANGAWTAEGVSVPALVVCLLLIATFVVLGILWTRKPETRKRGVLTLAALFVPTILSAVAMAARLFAS